MWAVLTALCFAQADGGRAPRPEPVAEVVHGGRTVRQTREVMHTKVTIAFADPPREGLSDHQADFDAAFAVFAHIDRTMNEWRDDSPLAAINASAGDAGVPVPEDLCEVVRLSLEGAKKTNGLFDPTWAA